MQAENVIGLNADLNGTQNRISGNAHCREIRFFIYGNSPSARQ